MINFDNIPNQLKQCPQWVTWRAEKTATGRITKIPYNPITLSPAASTDPTQWVSFDVAAEAFSSGGWDGVGFVLSADDPFTFIDLDDPYAVDDEGKAKHKEPEKIAEAQAEVYKRFGNTYSEISPSGKGLHIIAIGKLKGKGRRRHGIEIYSAERFMTVTGNVYNNAAIVENQANIDWLYNELGGPTQLAQAVGEYVDKEPDEVIIAKCLGATNGDKVRDLVSGNWQLHYGSQSEADFALIDIIAYYTKSIWQIVRLFRQSALGQRDKAQRDKYVLDMINRAFDRHLSPLDIEAIKEAIPQTWKSPAQGGSSTLSEASRSVAASAAYLCQDAVSGQPDSPIASIIDPSNPYHKPVPGLLGQIAYYIYDQAPRPVPEIALAGAIGLMAGICGRSFNVSGTGLNQYTLLLAGTGRGKEAIASGLSKLMHRVCDVNYGGVPAAVEFMGPGDIASGQALVKHMDKVSRSFVSVLGEVDGLLKNMTARNANAGLVKLRTVMLDLYNKSGAGNVLQGTIYSDRDKNAASIASPAFSLVGEGTPQRFYNLLDEAMVSDGLLPRFTIIEYDGPRVEANENRMNVQPSLQLVKAVGALAAFSLMINQQNRPINVEITPDAKAMLTDFDKKADAIINEAHNDVIEQLWNRSHLKAMKLASLVAVGVNMHKPTIDVEMVEWALAIVQHSTRRLVAKFETGDVGDGFSKQMADLKKAIIKMLSITEARAVSLGMSDKMRRDHLISHRGLQQYLANIASFKNSRDGGPRAFQLAMQSLLDGGVLAIVPPSQLKEKYNRDNGRYYVLVAPEWLE